jgi:hypothetical protein
MTFLALGMTPTTLRLLLGAAVAGAASIRFAAAYVAHAPSSIPARLVRRIRRMMSPQDGFAFPAERFLERVFNRIQR